MNDSIKRLLRTFAPGERIRASLDIYFAVSDFEVKEGALGVVIETRLVGVAVVVWDEHPDVCVATSVDNIDSVPS